jgi:hypothetical protein
MKLLFNGLLAAIGGFGATLVCHVIARCCGASEEVLTIGSEVLFGAFTGIIGYVNGYFHGKDDEYDEMERRRRDLDKRAVQCN